MSWLKNFLCNWLEISKPESIDLTKYCTKREIREEIASCLNYTLSKGPVLDYYRYWSEYISQTQQRKYLENLKDLAVDILTDMIAKEVNKESFLDDIIVRIKNKQL